MDYTPYGFFLFLAIMAWVIWGPIPGMNSTTPQTGAETPPKPEEKASPPPESKSA
jgi:hypothetical protein